MEKEYNIKLIVEFQGKSIGETRQEAIKEIDIPDFIDEALHDEHYKILKTTPKLAMLSTLLLSAQKDEYETDTDAKLEKIDREDNRSYSRT